ncbi:type VI secretion system tube protein Hcp [Methylomonas sp. SURF-2]|uniref:Type VI secretion system tube protein Hcp n=1 Tax=Methylomonas subterranea TaxID=2952225 RepID=A0ABT1TJT2_9GAMM|nr:type VI secretion system tube protein Hcp [Methylomonas sp. SURF-2]MCQ8105332.1 type VI secretion system tube protein Hcp [Methylomonas sp. SURF-2]
MAFDMFLKIKDVKGEAQDDKHKDTIDVLAWSWGMSNSGTTHMGSGSGAGKVNVQDLSVTKYVDKSTPDLLKACCNGKHFETADLIVRKAGEKPVEYLTITMTDLIVTAVSTGGSGGEDRLTENVTLNFGAVKVKYVEQTAKGGEGAKPDMGWDIAANKAL